GQMPFCLAFTVWAAGIVRHLTMSEKNQSLSCEANRPIGETVFKIPPREGQVKIYVVFSDRELDGSSIGSQLHEFAEKGSVTAMDFRAPGTVAMDLIEFTPAQ